MKNIWKYVLVGCLVAIGGMFVAQFSGQFFNGMSFDSAAVLGICMYLCIVIVICTGIIICKIDDTQNPEKKESDKIA